MLKVLYYKIYYITINHGANNLMFYYAINNMLPVRNGQGKVPKIRNDLPQNLRVSRGVKSSFNFQFKYIM